MASEILIIAGSHPRENEFSEGVVEQIHTLRNDDPKDYFKQFDLRDEAHIRDFGRFTIAQLELRMSPMAYKHCPDIVGHVVRYHAPTVVIDLHGFHSHSTKDGTGLVMSLIPNPKDLRPLDERLQPMRTVLSLSRDRDPGSYGRVGESQDIKILYGLREEDLAGVAREFPNTWMFEQEHPGLGGSFLEGLNPYPFGLEDAAYFFEFVAVHGRKKAQRAVAKFILEDLVPNVHLFHRNEEKR